MDETRNINCPHSNIISHFQLSEKAQRRLLLTEMALTIIGIVGGLIALTVFFPYIMLPILGVGIPIGYIALKATISPSAREGILALLHFGIFGFEKKPATCARLDQPAQPS